MLKEINSVTFCKYLQKSTTKKVLEIEANISFKNTVKPRLTLLRLTAKN